MKKIGNKFLIEYIIDSLSPLALKCLSDSSYGKKIQKIQFLIN